MLRLFKNKKGTSDLPILWGIVVIFILLGTVLPFIKSELEGGGTSSIDTDSLTEDIDDETDFTSISALTILFSIAKMFFWTFSDVPLIIDLVVLTPMRVFLGLILYRQLRGGSG